MPQTPQANLREKIRLNIRHQRNHLSQDFQHHASQQLVQQVALLPELNKAKTIALYLTNDGELNTDALIKWCWQQNKQVVIPKLHPFTKGYLIFQHYHKNSLMQKNRYNIAEPVLNVTQLCLLNNIDIIFTPLVAFDNNGHRLGMGGGFYDRTLSALTHQQNTSVIGIAHDCQQVERVPIEPWDIPIPKIVTPTRIIKAG